MSKATKGTSTLFPQVSRGESNDAAKGLLLDSVAVSVPHRSTEPTRQRKRTGSEIDVANFGCLDGSPVPAIGFDEAPRTP